MGLLSRRPTPEPATGVAANGLPRESVWDYPRPPRIEPVQRRVTVTLGGAPVAATDRAVRVVETAGAPAVYIAPAEIAEGALRPSSDSSFCEWKGAASYFDVIAGDGAATNAAWAYPRPSRAFAELAGWVSFFPALVECRLGDERVEPQPGDFYGGWVTAEICGPIKGSPGSAGW